ncbi:hypothetical protein HMPREF0208_03465 [Citrobacter koseri]|nr:hypothetical protein HMPREF3207_01835 [Citrobacter koseri]KXA03926.1 hypothetical protein HMPREF3220_00534 [Citrobacter koseri]KXB41934.1 hypothetical protein HMPREF0208_03465 [Citrobacter koseri]
MSSQRSQLSDLHHTFAPFSARFIPYSRMANKRSNIFSLPRHKS